jgi:hypothetical protein
MNKRSAMLVAAGLVLTLMVGGVAIAIGMTGPSASAASPKTAKQHHKQKPIIKTIRRTVTIHKKAPAAGVAAPVYAASQGSSSVSYSSVPRSAPSYGDDGGYEHEDGSGGSGSHGGGDD